MAISLNSLAVRLVAVAMLGKAGGVALNYYDAMRSSDRCFSVESPDARFVIETFPDFRVFAMPGDGGCHDSSSTLRLRTASGKLIHEQHAETFDLRVQWETEYDAVRVPYSDGVDKFEWWLWNRPEDSAKPADYVQRRLNMMVENADLSSIKRMLRDGAKLDAVDQEGKLPLVLAAGSGDENLVKRLLDAGANVNQADGFGSTALHWSRSDNGNFGVSRITKLLVEAGAAVNARDHFGQTPLASGFRNLEEVTYLVDHGADVTAVSKDGTPVIASYCSDPKVFSFLLQKGAKVDFHAPWVTPTVYQLALGGKTDRLRYFESQGADIQTALSMRNELVPLAEAIRAANFGMVVFLIEHHADLNELDPTSGKRIWELLDDVRKENRETPEECRASKTQVAFDCDFETRLERIAKFVSEHGQRRRGQSVTRKAERGTKGQVSGEKGANAASGGHGSSAPMVTLLS
ncbi:MAG: ankyrin repeat domain-containing protein [Bdellovibrionota bacterium]